MPNIVTNNLIIKDTGTHTLKEIKDAITNSDNLVDFNRVAPMPKLAFCTKDTLFSADLLRDPKDHARLRQLKNLMPKIDWDSYDYQNKESMDKLDQELNKGLEQLKKNNQIAWYSNRVKEWDKRTNAHNQPKSGWPDDTSTYRFDTAWSHPFAIMTAISKKFPKATFLVEYADECIGVNCGSYRLKNGERTKESIMGYWKDTSHKSREFYRQFAHRVVHGDIEPKFNGYDKNWHHYEKYYRAYVAAEITTIVNENLIED